MRTSINKSVLYARTTRKNHLRRESGLPIIDVRQEMKREANRLDVLKYCEACAVHKNDYPRMYEEARLELCSERGRNLHLSSGGQYAIRHRANAKFAGYLRSLGFVKPETDGMRYGADRRQQNAR